MPSKAIKSSHSNKALKNKLKTFASESASMEDKLQEDTTSSWVFLETIQKFLALSEGTKAFSNKNGLKSLRKT